MANKEIKKNKPRINKQLIKSSNPFPVAGIGASAGGLEAFKKLLAAIPKDSGIAYVLVQHLDPNHDSALPELLQKVTSIPVIEITNEIKIQADHIYIIPSNKLMIANDGVLELSPRPSKEHAERNLPIDLFFTSLAEVHQSHAIGVVLSGTASDGTLGLKAIKDNGGVTLAQDGASAAFDGMPQSAVQAGVVDFILPPEKIPKKLLEITAILNGDNQGLQTPHVQDEDIFKQIVTLLRIRQGTDFTHYKQTTIRRRILRRTALSKNEELSAYLSYLRENIKEQDILYQDLLIPVTGFFRDPQVFDILCKHIFPVITQNKISADPIRVWVAGCSSGEEVYSIAICLKEFVASTVSRRTIDKIQIFATDLSEKAIFKARSGFYKKGEVAGLTSRRLQDFFTKTNAGYQVNKEVRDLCVFAVHNFLKDPPFSKIDFISCRNTLIYMEPYLQKKALTTFHYSLNPDGFLLLGRSESTSGVPELFEVSRSKDAGKNDKFFIPKSVPYRFMHLTAQRSEQNFADMQLNQSENNPMNFQKNADDIILSKYAPAGVVINEAMDIVQFRGSTGNYLEPAPGKPSMNLLKMAKEGLSFELRNLIHKAKTENKSVKKENILVHVAGNKRIIELEAIPLINTTELHFLILFHDKEARISSIQSASQTAAFSPVDNDEKHLRIQQLVGEMAQMREDMRTITEELEAANEELQSSNEELLSGSEELQSINEELQSSQEELQSSNEELTVVNQELLTMNEQVTVARDYAEAIIITIREPLLVLDQTLRVKTANKSFYKTFQVTESQTEGRLIYELGMRQWDIPKLRELLEHILPHKSKFTDLEIEFNFPNIGQRIMLLNAREIVTKSGGEKLILLAIEDVTEKKKFDEKVKASDELFRFLDEAMPQKVWTADIEGNMNYFNLNWLSFTGLSLEELKGWGWKKIIHPDDWPETEKRWRKSIKQSENFEIEHRFLQHDGKYRWHLSRGLPQRDKEGKIILWIGTNTDMHNIKAEEKRKDDFVKMVSHELKTPVTSIKGYVQLLLILTADRSSIQDPLMLTDTLSRIDRQVVKLTRLIAEMLDLSRIEADRLELQPELFSINQLVGDTVEDIRLTSVNHVIRVENEYSCMVKGDKGRIEQVIINLLANAIKYSPENTQIEVRVQQVNKDRVGVSVKDYGIGIDGEEHQKIFERFYRVDGKSEQTFPGFGIGLFIANEIIQRHNGVITIESVKDKGSLFTFTLPVVKES